MIPRVAKKGRSFKGAALYYLHDKGAKTRERVSFIEVANMPEGSAERPERAFAHMIDTAEHAGQLKRDAGLKAGRKMKDPVYSYSLSWHPSERPTRADMMAAAKETLAAIGLGDRQAVFIAHNDTAHPHIHVIANRVCQETGRAATMGNDRLILSDWALRYRRERGQEQEFCPERSANKAKREQGQWKTHKQQSRQTWYETRKARSDNLWGGYRVQKEALKGRRKSQSDALWRQKDERIEARRREVKATFRPAWRDLFKQQRQELKEFDQSWIARINFVLAQPRHKLHGLMMVAAGATGELRREMELTHATSRKGLANHQSQATRTAMREVTKAWKYDRDQLFEGWKAQDKAMYKEAKAQSSRIWEKEQPANDPAAEQPQEPSKTRRSFGDRVSEGKTPQQKAERATRAARRSRSRPRGGRGRDPAPD